MRFGHGEIHSRININMSKALFMSIYIACGVGVISAASGHIYLGEN